MFALELLLKAHILQLGLLLVADELEGRVEEGNGGSGKQEQPPDGGADCRDIRDSATGWGMGLGHRRRLLLLQLLRGRHCILGWGLRRPHRRVPQRLQSKCRPHGLPIGRILLNVRLFLFH